MKTFKIDEGSVPKHCRPSTLRNPRWVGVWIDFNWVRIRRRLVHVTILIPSPPPNEKRRQEKNNDKTSQRLTGRRGEAQNKQPVVFPLVFAPSLTARGTNVSVCSWGCSATFGHCFLKRTRGVNEVQQPLCKSRLLTRRRRYDDASVPVCVFVYVRARASASLCGGD